MSRKLVDQLLEQNDKEHIEKRNGMVQYLISVLPYGMRDMISIVFDYWIHSQCEIPWLCYKKITDVTHLLGICQMGYHCMWCVRKTGSIAEDCELHHESCPFWLAEKCDVKCYEMNVHHKICQSRGKPVIRSPEYEKLITL